MTLEELIKHIIEEQKQYAHSPLIGFDLEGVLNQVAEAAKKEGYAKGYQDGKYR